jgi:hypothetical protein
MRATSKQEFTVMNIVTETIEQVKIDTQVRLTLLSRPAAPRKGRPAAWALRLEACRSGGDLADVHFVEEWQWRLLHDALQPERDWDNDLLRLGFFFSRVPGDTHHGERKWYAEETPWLTPERLPAPARRVVEQWLEDVHYSALYDALTKAETDPLTRAARLAGYGYEDQPGADLYGFVHDAADNLVRSLGLGAYEATPEIYALARDYIRRCAGDVGDARADLVRVLEVE